MDTPKLSLLSSALLTLSVASSPVAAGDCARSKADGGYDQNATYRPAVYYETDVDSIQRLWVGHHMSGHAKPMTSPSQQDIVEIAASAGDFDTLVVAVKMAGLAETLKGEGPFTVFAPTDAAFAKLPKRQLEALLNDKAALTEVLAYHVVPGRVKAADVVKLSSAKTVQGQSIRIDTRNGVMVDNARVIKTDIEAQNGIIHVIDTVIMPN